MAIAIHHTLRKKATKSGIELKIEGDEIVAYQGNKVLGHGVPAKAVLELAITKAQAAAKEEEEEREANGRSIIRRKYKKLYRPHDMTCGDDLSTRLSGFVQAKDPDTGEIKVDRDRLRRVAELNGIWKPDYALLNSGQMRMTIGNRLRAKVRKGHEPKWN